MGSSSLSLEPDCSLEPLTAAEARTAERNRRSLELLAGLYVAAGDGRVSLGADEWEDLLRFHPPRERTLVVLRYLHGVGPQAAADWLGVSRMRVWQIEDAAFKRFRQRFTEPQLRRYFGIEQGAES